MKARLGVSDGFGGYFVLAACVKACACCFGKVQGNANVADRCFGSCNTFEAGIDRGTGMAFVVLNLNVPFPFFDDDP